MSRQPYRELVHSAWEWLVDAWHWPAAGLLAAGLLLALLPVFYATGGLAVLLVAAQLPAYLVHQGEEHISDRFRLFVNKLAGCEALSRSATFWINSVGVWGVDILSLLFMVFVHPAWGVLAVYLTLVNAVVHIGAGLKQRQGNPGLVSAVLVFLPVGGFGLSVLSQTAGVTILSHVLAIVAAVAVHVAIILWIVVQKNRLRRAT
jgi:Protein of unknown function with HXXEE motif